MDSLTTAGDADPNGKGLVAFLHEATMCLTELRDVSKTYAGREAQLDLAAEMGLR